MGKQLRRGVAPLVGFVTVLLVSTAVSATNIGLPPGGTFTDDNGTTHEGMIEAIAARGITKGCNPPANSRYCPDQGVTRGQMAAFLVRSLPTLTETTADYFRDDAASVFEDDINRLAAAGIARGCNPPKNDQFCPERRVTRGQMAAFLSRGFAYSNVSGADRFRDDDNSVFELDIERLAAAGVTLGCNPPANTLFCPNDDVGRGQMASFLGRALNLTPITPPPPVQSCDSSYPDVCIKPPPPDLDCDDIPHRDFRVTGSDPHRFDGDNDGIGCETTAPPPPKPPRNCDPSYPTVCIKPPPPDLDCGEIPYRNFRVVGSDPHRFDGDNDGIGCET